MSYLNKSLLFQLFALVFLTACVSVPSDFEAPKVTVTSFTPVSNGSMAPEFQIVLRVSNPNRIPLEVEGMSYSIDIDGNEVMSGVSTDLPVIAAYGEGDVTLRATPNLFGGLQLMKSLMNKYKDQFEYSFNAKLDVGALTPSIRVNKKGSFSLVGNNP